MRGSSVSTSYCSEKAAAINKAIAGLTRILSRNGLSSYLKLRSL